MLYSSNRHLITINKNNDHQAVKTKDNQYKIKIENNNENSIKSFCINVIGILSERINGQDLSEKLHEKQDLEGINIKKDRKIKERYTAVVAFGTGEYAETATGEINKTEQFTQKK